MLYYLINKLKVLAQFLVSRFTGFIRSHLARKLLELKHTLIGIVDLSTIF